MKNETKLWDGKVQTMLRRALTISFLAQWRKQVSQIWQIVRDSTLLFLYFYLFSEFERCDVVT
jgi:hypothetical protein